MALAGKEIGEYLKIIKWPLIISILLAVLSLVFIFVPFMLWFGGWFLWLIGVFLASWAGWMTVKDYSGNLLQAFIAGVFLGVIAGAVSGVLGIVRLAFFPMFNAMGMIGAFAIGAAIMGLFWGIVGGAIFSGVFSLIGGLIAGGKSK